MLLILTTLMPVKLQASDAPTHRMVKFLFLTEHSAELI